MKLDYAYECTLSILVENQPAILTRIIGLLSQRAFTIDSLAVGTNEYDGLSRIIIVLLGNLRLVDQLTRQLYKVLPTIKIFNLTNSPSITRELILIKIFANSSERHEIFEMAKIFDLNIISFTS